MEGLEQFLEEELTEEERRHFLDNTIRIMVNKALHLKRWRPPKGLMFSLQQQSRYNNDLTRDIKIMRKTVNF